MIHSEQILFLANHLLGRLYPSKPKHAPLSILIVKLDEIGDAICALPAINELISKNPGAAIDILCKPYCNDVFKGIKGIHKILNTESQWTKKYDWVVELRGNWSTFFKSLRYWPAFRFNRGTVRLQNKGKQKHEIDTNFDIISSINAKDQGVRNWPKSIKEESAIANFKLENTIGQYVVVHASARKKLRKWGSENFKNVSSYLWKKHAIKSVYIGVQSETEQIQEITIGREEYTVNAAGVFPLSQLAELLKQSAFFIGNESGPLQLADYLNIPSLSFFGPGVPTVFYPRNVNSIVLHHVLDCNPCDQINCVKETPCIDLISLAEAQIAMEEIINKTS